MSEKSGLSLSRLIALVGDDNVRLERLDENMLSVKERKKPFGAEVTFFTQGVTPTEVYRWTTGQQETLGLVVWLPRALVDQALATYHAEAESAKDLKPQSAEALDATKAP